MNPTDAWPHQPPHEQTRDAGFRSQPCGFPSTFCPVCEGMQTWHSAEWYQRRTTAPSGQPMYGMIAVFPCTAEPLELGPENIDLPKPRLCSRHEMDAALAFAKWCPLCEFPKASPSVSVSRPSVHRVSPAIVHAVGAFVRAMQQTWSHLARGMRLQQRRQPQLAHPSDPAIGLASTFPILQNDRRHRAAPNDVSIFRGPDRGSGARLCSPSRLGFRVKPVNAFLTIEVGAGRDRRTPL